MKRREFLLATLIGPFIPLPKPDTKLLWAPPGYEDKARELIASYPKMDRFVNAPLPRHSTAKLFYKHPCSRLGCNMSSGWHTFWLHPS